VEIVIGIAVVLIAAAAGELLVTDNAYRTARLRRARGARAPAERRERPVAVHVLHATAPVS